MKEKKHFFSSYLATGSIDNLKGTLRIDKYAGDPFSIRIDAQNKETLKLVFIKLLNQVTSMIQAEQFFCQEFFNPTSLSHLSKSDSQTSNEKNKNFQRTGSSNSLQSSASTNVSRQSGESSKIELYFYFFFFI